MPRAVSKKGDREAPEKDSERKQERKRPGRPRKTPDPPPKRKMGVEASPTFPTNHTEFCSDDPMGFKRIWVFLRATAVKKVQMIFRQRDILLYAIDHFEQSKICLHIDCDESNHYYNKELYQVGVDSELFDRVMNKISVGYTGITIKLAHRDMDSKIHVTLNPPIDIEETHDIDLTRDYPALPDKGELEFTQESIYKVSLELPGKYFKKMMTDIKGCKTDTICIVQETAASNVAFEYRSKDKKLAGRNILKNSKQFKITSKLGEFDIFRTEVKLAYIKPLSAALPPDSIRIFGDNDADILSVININSLIEMRILTRTEKDE